MDNVQPMHEPDETAMLAHLEFLFGDVTLDGRIEISAIADGHGAHAAQFALTDLEDAVTYAAEKNRRGFNVYVGNALIRPDAPPMGRADDDDYAATVAVYADLDDADSVPHAQAIISAAGLKPTAYVVTGTVPSPRLQLWWKLDEPMIDPVKHRMVMAMLASVLKGDSTIQNPSRIMRLGGGVAWPTNSPKKRGRPVEVTKFNLSAPSNRFDATRIVKGFQPYLPQVELPAAANNEQPAQISLASNGNSEAARGTLSGRVDVIRTLEQTREPGTWHNNMLAAVASMVQRGWSDEAIRLASAAYCDRGVNDPDLAPLINTARRKWERPDPGDQSGAVMQPATQEEEPPPGPFRASDLIGTPPERKWLVPEWVPMNTVTSLYGDGGTGKTLLAQQLAYACAIDGGMWIGQQTANTESLCVFCEDQRDELHRRHNAISAGMGYPMGNPFEKVSLWPRVGYDNMLVTFDASGIAQETPFLARVVEEALWRQVGLLILDTAADLFGGNEIVRVQVNHFVKAICGKAIRLANEQGRDLSVVLLAHPSVSGMQTKTGMSGSTAWNGAVRSRLYLTKMEDADPDMRMLTRMKANYAQAGDETGTRLYFKDGILIPLERADGAMGQAQMNNLKERIKAEIARAWSERKPYSKQGAMPLKDIHKALPHDDRMMIATALNELVAAQDIVEGRTQHARGYRLNDGENDQ